MSKFQKTIDDFYKNTNDNFKIKKYFYLKWDNQYLPSLNAYWTDERPKKINFIEQVYCNNIKKGYYFYLCGLFSDINENEYKLSKDKTYKNIPYLKSHLQKSIRKQNENLSLQTTYHLFKLDLNELLRRLPIIMIEDLYLHESFTTLIWLMIAYSVKKFKMKLYIYEWILGLVYVMCKIDKKDEINENLNNKNGLKEILDNYNDLEEYQLSILYCMHFRNIYGLMEGDKIMISKFANTWEDRFRNNKEKIDNTEIKPIKIFIKEMNIDDWDVSAIDFHCNTKILEYLHNKFDHIDKDELKKLIWCNSSSINKRKKSTIYKPELWNEIKNYLKKTQKYLLDSSY